ncbi:MAG: DUF58 domain-containing protein [Ilumatobacteraceae bacterium]
MSRSRLGPFTVTGVIVALLGVVCYVAGWQLGWIELMVTAAGCLAALLIAVGFVVGRLAIDIERDVDPERVMVGEPAGALLTARNPGRRPTRSIVVDEHIAEDILPVTVPTLAPGSEHRTFYQLPTDRRARVTIGPAEVVRADPLGLLRRRVGHAPATELWVHPRWSLVDALPSGFAKDLEGPTSDASPAGDIAFHALRPYQLGDDRRHIHWMSTARSGTLMVRHYVDNRRPTLAVLLDETRAAYDDAQFEVAVEIVTSLVLSSLALRLPVAARTTSDWILGRLRPQGRDGVLETLTLVERRADTTALVLAAAELARVESASSAIAVVTGSRTAQDLLPMVTHLRSRARVIVIVVDRAAEAHGSAAASVRSLPGATVVNVTTLDEFRAGWNGIRA